MEKYTRQLEQYQKQIIPLMTKGKSLATDENMSFETNLLQKDNRFDSLTRIQVWAYGVGHFINDLVAACWFNFLFYYLKRVVETPASNAALLVGQICDGIATLIVGYISDKHNTRWGQRTPWYVFGLVLVFVCYIPIYQGFTSQNKAVQYAYYTILPGLFNIGWAALQISHMSLVPSLTCSRKRRDKLNNLRNTFTFISNFVVLGMGVLIFKFMNDRLWEYRIISYLVAGLGLSAGIFFLWHIKEVPLAKACTQKAQSLKQQIAQRKKIDRQRLNSVTQFSEDEENQIHSSKRIVKAQTIKDWFKMPKFYFFGICYMGVRLYTNIFGTFLPFYLEGVLKLGYYQKTESKQVPFTVALVPLIVYLSSVVMSSKLNKFYEIFGRKKALFIGTIICCIALGLMYLITQQTNWVIYILALFIGCSQTMVLSTGINFISDVVGTKAKTGAFVFGCYSLLDKFSAGAVIYFVGSTPAYETDPAELSDYQRSFIRHTIILIPALACIMSSVIVLAYPVKQYSRPKFNAQNGKRDSLEEQLVA